MACRVLCLPRRPPDGLGAVAGPPAPRGPGIVDGCSVQLMVSFELSKPSPSRFNDNPVASRM